MNQRLAWRQRQRHGLTIYESSYLDWMGFATAGMLHPGHRALIDYAIANISTADPVIEIGAFCGLSTNVLAYFLRKHRRTNILFAVDPWDFERSVEEREMLPESDLTFTRYREYVRDQYERNTRFWTSDNPPYTLELHSDAFFAKWANYDRETDLLGREVELGGPSAFCFIDGDHRPEQARRDVDNADRVLVSGGFLLLDDTDRFGAFPHLYRLAMELVKKRRYRLIGENPHHLLLKE